MISGVINLGSLFLGLATKAFSDNEDIADAAKSIDKVRNAYNVVSTTSVTESASRTIIAPMVVIDSASIHQEYMSDLMQIVNLRDVIATLTHLAMQGSLGVGVKVSTLISSINPRRAGLMALAGIEALDTNLKSKEVKDKENDRDKEMVEYVNVNGKNMPDLNEYTPLALGRVVIATLRAENGTSYDIPLTFRQIPVPMDTKGLERVFGAAKIEDGLFARATMVETKEITIPDFLSGKDIIKQRFRIANEDMTGYYRQAMKDETGNRMAALRTGVISVNNLANTFIFNQDQANQIELSIGRRFGNVASRNEIFKAVKANTIVVVNEDRGLFTFYTHGQDRPEVYTRKDIAMKSKKDVGSNNLADLVKLINGGV
jgi:hypothetical protein